MSDGRSWAKARGVVAAGACRSSDSRLLPAVPPGTTIDLKNVFDGVTFSCPAELVGFLAYVDAAPGTAGAAAARARAMDSIKSQGITTFVSTDADSTVAGYFAATTGAGYVRFDNNIVAQSGKLRGPAAVGEALKQSVLSGEQPFLLFYELPRGVVSAAYGNSQLPARAPVPPLFGAGEPRAVEPTPEPPAPSKTAVARGTRADTAAAGAAEASDAAGAQPGKSGKPAKASKAGKSTSSKASQLQVTHPGRQRSAAAQKPGAGSKSGAAKSAQQPPLPPEPPAPAAVPADSVAAAAPVVPAVRHGGKVSSARSARAIAAARMAAEASGGDATAGGGMAAAAAATTAAAAKSSSQSAKGSSQSGSKGKEVVCRNCGKPDHFSKSCPTLTCRRCGKLGHMGSACPEAVR